MIIFGALLVSFFFSLPAPDAARPEVLSVVRKIRVLSGVVALKEGRSGREHFTTRRSHRNGATYEADCGSAPARCLRPVPHVSPAHNGETLSEFWTCVRARVCDCMFLTFSLCLVRAPFSLSPLPNHEHVYICT